MRHRWESLTFLHWGYPVEEVQRLLPPGLSVEPWEGRAWVGLVPFRMLVKPPLGPAIPLLSRFPETNVRTYVTGPDGEPGVWFFSLDAANPAAVTAARLAFGLPYYLSRMNVADGGDGVRYRSSRLARGRGRPGHRIEVVPGPGIPPGDLSEFDHYLTARFRLWARNRGAVFSTEVEHDPWPLRRATVRILDQDLVQDAGLRAPEGDPVVHYSDGVEVRIGRPRRPHR